LWTGRSLKTTAEVDVIGANLWHESRIEANGLVSGLRCHLLDDVWPGSTQSKGMVLDRSHLQQQQREELSSDMAT
jgi:hypothetical protein